MTFASPRPPAARREELVEWLHGIPVADPYRWLEDGASPETQEWTAAQNAHTAAILGALPGREAVAAQLEALLTIGTHSVPVPRGGRLFYTRRAGHQEQPVLYWRQGELGPEIPLVDPAVYEPDAASALDWWYPAPDGRLVACGISRAGTEQSVLSVRVVETGEELAERIPHTRYASLAWLPDGTGFYYTRYPAGGTVPPGEEHYHRRVYFHALGTPWQEDPLVFGEGRPKEEMVSLHLSPDGRWLCVAAYMGWSRNDLFLLDRTRPERGFRGVVRGKDALFEPVVLNDRLYVRTNLDAPRYRLFRVDPARPSLHRWEEVLREAEGVLEDVAVAGGLLVCTSLRNASSELALRTPDGRLLRSLPLPGIGSVTGLGAAWDHPVLYYGFVSFVTPTRIYREDLYQGAPSHRLWHDTAPAGGRSPEEYTVEQEWCTSRDGTRVSLFVVRRRDAPLDGNRPTVLYGYGGFNVALTPSFLRGAQLLLERGGVYALANLRGGAEYGEAWHRAGMREHKQNVFDDFLAAAEHLIERGYTRPQRLAIQGGSNGGLLVGAAITRRPELFRAGVCAVPLLDMLRYHRFLIARLWIPELGCADDPEQFRFLHAYSPYHRVRDEVCYPALLLTAAEGDTRVDALHARKFAARLQAASAGPGPVLLRVETRAGHGAGKPLHMLLEEATDTWCFLLWQLQVLDGSSGAAPGDSHA